MDRLCARFAAEEGSALPTVLVLVVVVSILAGSILLVQALQHRFVQRDVHRLQARYAAEAGVYRALADLDGNLRPVRASYDIDGVDRCSVWVEPFGGLARVHASATVRSEEVTLRALAGERPPSAFDAAIVMDDVRSSLTLTGTTRIQGTVWMGERGVEQTDLRGEPFSGSLNGRVRTQGDLELPTYDTSAYGRTIRRANHLLQIPSNAEADPSAASREFEAGRTTPLSGMGRRVHTVTDSVVTVTGRDSLFRSGPALLIATGALELHGSLSVPSGSIVLAGSTLSIGQGVEGHDAVFYAQDTLRVREAPELSGQFLSETFVGIRDRAELSYPSVVYVSEPEGQIRIRDRAEVNGLLLYPSRPSRPRSSREVVVQSDAGIRGAVYNRGQTELWGAVEGSVLTHQFGFYRSPTHYVNWVKDASIRRDGRPEDFVVPFGFADASRPAILRWTPAPPDTRMGRDDSSNRSE